MDETNSKDRVKKIMAKLDKLYKKDDAISKFQSLATFETYKRPSKLSVPEYINQFQKRFNKVKEQLVNPNELKLLVQSGNAAALDSSANKTACSQVWLDNYVDLLHGKEKINIQFSSSSSVYRFGDG